MKKTILVCGGAALMTALLGAFGVSAVRIFRSADPQTLALGAMLVAAPLLALFIHFSFDGRKHNSHKHKGA